MDTFNHFHAFHLKTAKTADRNRSTPSPTRSKNRPSQSSSIQASPQPRCTSAGSNASSPDAKPLLQFGRTSSWEANRTKTPDGYLESLNRSSSGRQNLHSTFSDPILPSIFLSEEIASVNTYKKERRRQQNRNAQRNYRMRQETMMHTLRIECAQLREENNALRRHMSLPEQNFRNSIDLYQSWSESDFANLPDEDFSMIYGGYSDADLNVSHELPPELGIEGSSTTMFHL